MCIPMRMRAQRGILQHASGGAVQHVPPSRRMAVGRATSRQQGDPPASSDLEFLVTCHPGLQQAVAAELQDPVVGVRDPRVLEPPAGGVTFTAPSLEAGYRAVLWLRSAVRVLVKLGSAPLDPRRQAYDTVYAAVREMGRWPELLPPRRTVAVTGQVWSNSNLTNSQLLSRCVRDAVCDAVRDVRGARPAPPTGAADLPLHASAVRDELTLWRELSGGSLHRRGYRSAMHRASLNEAAAAGLLQLAGWGAVSADAGKDDVLLADPMCGSGTFLIEAALMARRMAPGLARVEAWPFQCWHDFDASMWACAVDAARATERPWHGQLLGNDLHEGALALARRDAAAAGVADVVALRQGDCALWVPPAVPRMVATNPPWGQRIGGGEGDGSGSGMAHSWQSLSRFLKEQCPGMAAWVLSGSSDATRELRMRSVKQRSVTIGGVKAKWLKYEVRPLPPHEYRVLEPQPTGGNRGGRRRLFEQGDQASLRCHGGHEV